MIFTTSEMLKRRLLTVSAPDQMYYALDLPAHVVKLHHPKDSCYPPLIQTCTFYAIKADEFDAFKEFHARFSSLPKGCGAQYVVLGGYPIAYEFMLEGTQYTGAKQPTDWSALLEVIGRLGA